jgi:hypothetical protein
MLPLQLQQPLIQQGEESAVLQLQLQGQVQQQQQQLQQFRILQGPSTSTGLTWGRRRRRLPDAEQAEKKKTKKKSSMQLQEQEQQQQGRDLMLQQLQLPPPAVRTVLPSGLFSCQGRQQAAAAAAAQPEVADQRSTGSTGAESAPSCKQLPPLQGRPQQQRSPLLQSGVFSCQGKQEAAAATGAAVQHQQQQLQESIPLGAEDCASAPLGRLQQQMHDYA